MLILTYYSSSWRTPLPRRALEKGNHNSNDTHHHHQILNKGKCGEGNRLTKQKTGGGQNAEKKAPDSASEDDEPEG